MADAGARALSFFDAWETRDFDAMMKHFAGGATVNDHPRGTVITAPSEIRDWMTSWVTACPDATGGVSVAAASTDAAVLLGTYVGMNTGPLGPLPASGRPVSMPFAIAMRFDAKGAITQYDVYYDQLTLLTQLGHAPAMA